jgi:hypothetical protein
MTYQGADGRQYVVIAAGGHDRLNTTLGDYVIAYALGGGASAPNEVLFSLAPDWTGELREPARLRTAWQLRARGDSVSGTMRVDDPAVTGTVTGVRHGNAIALRIAFDYPGKKCSGVLAGDGSLANGGALLEGVLSETGTCTDRQGSKLSVLLRTAGAR